MRAIAGAPAGGGRRRAAGFTLLEAIVALALIASIGLALMAWINTSLAAVSRLQERDAQAQLKLAAAQAIQTVNPMARPEGELELGALVVRWQAQPEGSPATSAGYLEAGVGRFSVQLFDVQVQARDAASGAELAFNATLLGYRFNGVPDIDRL